MPVEIRTVAAGEFAAWVAVMLAAEHDTADPEPDAAFRRPAVDFARTLGAFDGTQVVGTLRSFPTRLTLPGGEVVANAITDVGVAPTHRRQGLLSAMMRRDLATAAERGEPVAILIASEAAIYGRYGFGCAADWAVWCLDPRRAVFAAPLDAPEEVRLELVDTATLRALGPQVYERYRRGQPGAIERTDRWWDIALDLVDQPRPVPRGSQWVLARAAAGEPVGYLRYHVDTRWEDTSPAGTLVVDELLATTPVAYARLWRYCCQVDLVTEVRAPLRPSTEALPWLLTDGRVARLTYRADGLWLRVLDVPRTLTARGYDQSGSLAIEVVDPAGIASGRWRLDAAAGQAECRSTSAAADVRLSVQALGAVTLGGVSVTTLYQAGLVRAQTPAALATADVLFRGRVPPWCNTVF
jgi:predicted acetyltransferase